MSRTAIAVLVFQTKGAIELESCKQPGINLEPLKPDEDKTFKAGFH